MAMFIKFEGNDITYRYSQHISRFPWIVSRSDDVFGPSLQSDEELKQACDLEMAIASRTEFFQRGDGKNSVAIW